MLRLMDLERLTAKLIPVTSPEFFSKPGHFHAQGVFSEAIFGPLGSLDRRKRFSFINLKTKIIHPSILRILTRLDRKVLEFISTKGYFKITPAGELKRAEKGLTGLSTFIEEFPKITFRGESPEREKFIELVGQEYKKGNIFIDKIIVIPPDFRPAYQDKEDTWVIDILNNIYVGIIRKSQQLKSITVGEMFDILSYSMQQAVVDHDNFIRDKIGKKRGLVRSQLLGKRVDFSGRAVITPEPKLKSDQVGVPLRIAVKLFEPFVIHVLLYSGRDVEEFKKEMEAFYNISLSVELVKRAINAVAHGDEIPKPLYNIFWTITEVAMENRVVICKRDPVLHAESVRAFFPVLTTGNTLKISPLVVGGFNADFDGDQMAIFHPLTNEAQKEAREKLMNIRSSSSSRELSLELSKEMYAGIYLITKDVTRTTPPGKVTPEELEKATNPYLSVIYKGNITSMGKAIFNSCFPKDYTFIDKRVDKKVLKDILLDVQEKYDDNVIRETMYKLSIVGFKFATIQAPTFTIEDLEIPTEIVKLKDRLVGASIEEAAKILNMMESMLKKHLKDTGLDALISSGAGKGWLQPRQILVAKGLVSDAQGNILPVVPSSFIEGLQSKEYMNASYGARKGIVARVIGTADTGYFSRILAYVLNSVELSKTLVDCKTSRVINLRLNKELLYRLRGRYILDRLGKPILVDSIHQGTLEGKVVELRSPIYCTSKKICQTCYGNAFKLTKSPYIGLIAAQTIGERGTQVGMQSFHTGGVAEVKVRNMLKDIITNSPEVGLEI